MFVNNYYNYQHLYYVLYFLFIIPFIYYVVKDDKVYYDDFLTNEPIQIKVLHQGGGAYASALVKESGGFYNWLKQSVSSEVKEFIEHITN